MSNALEYAEQNSLMLDIDYPQTGHTNRACHYVEGEGKAKVIRFINILPNDPEQLKIAVSMAPVAASVAASSPLFLFYRGGVIESEECGTKVDSAVTIVGYGHDMEVDEELGSALRREYWIIKNSWGTSWGDHGYGRIAI